MFTAPVSQSIQRLCIALSLLISSSIYAQGTNIDSRLLATAQGAIKSLAISPDDRRVLYLDRTDGGDTTELYSVPINGGTPKVLNTSLVAGGDVSAFKVTPDGRQVVYRADQITDNVSELFIMPITGGSATRLNSPLSGDIDVREFLISPDGAFVVYRQAGGFSSGIEDFFSVELSSGNIVNLTLDLPSAFPRLVSSGFKVDRNSERLVFHTFSSGFSRNGVFSVQLNGQSLVKLNLNINIDGGDRISGLSFITADGNHLVYGLTNFTSAIIQLFRVPIDGSEEAVAITDRTSSENGFSRPAITPDGEFLVAQTKQLSSNSNIEIVKVPIFSDQAIQRLSQPLAVAGSDARTPQVSADGRFVVYQAEAESVFTDDLFKVSIDGGEPFQLNEAGTNNDVLFNFSFSPDGRHVVYAEEVNDSDDELRLLAAPISGGEQLVLSEILPNDDDEDLEFVISNNSQQVVYLTPNADALFVSSLADQELCFVIRAQNGKFATICL